MKNKLHMLVLLGLVSVGFSFDFERLTFVMPLIYLLIGVMTLRLRRTERVRSWSSIEAALLVIVIPGAYLTSRYLDIGPHPLIFIGNGLVVHQLFRLYLPMNHRERRYAMAVAVMHLAVGTFVVVDWKFVVIFGLAIYLIPGAMQQVEGAKYHQVAEAERIHPSWRVFAGVVVLMIAFFVAFPRMRPISSAFPGAQPRPPEEINIKEMPPAERNNVMIMQVEGEDLGYLKTHAYDLFDGEKWTVSPWGKKHDRQRGLWGSIEDDMIGRSVKIINRTALGNYFPTDRYPVRFSTNAPHTRALVAEHGGVVSEHRHRGNYSYRYWIYKRPGHVPPLDRRQQRRFRFLGRFRPSERLSTWLDETTAGIDDPKEVARTLEAYFQNNFVYDDAPAELDPAAPMDDFLFGEEKRGHCTRYATTLAVLLRLKGIPSRVATGYLPKEYNGLGGFYNIRAKHAHAWTEAWFPDTGWLLLDGTPNGAGVTLDRPELTTTVAEWVEYMWYAKVVEFDAFEQLDLFEGMNVGLVGAFRWVARRLWLLAVLPLLAIALAVIWRFLRRFRRNAAKSKRYHVEEAQHFYGKMLRLLARQAIHRRADQTPVEFAKEEVVCKHPCHNAIESVTRSFCDIRYGGRDYNHDTKKRVKDALDQIALKDA